jgi:ribosome-binding factor A
MADGRTRSRMAPPVSLHLCDEPGVEDGTDPRVFFRRGGRRENHKAKRLCGAVHRTLALCISSMLDDEAMRSLAVESVEPAPSAGWLTVVLRADRPLDPVDRRRVLRMLESNRGAFRTEIGSAVNRRRLPDLRFLVLGPGEARS